MGPGPCRAGTTSGTARAPPRPAEPPPPPLRRPALAGRISPKLAACACCGCCCTPWGSEVQKLMPSPRGPCCVLSDWGAAGSYEIRLERPPSASPSSAQRRREGPGAAAVEGLAGLRAFQYARTLGAAPWGWGLLSTGGCGGRRGRGRVPERLGTSRRAGGRAGVGLARRGGGHAWQKGRGSWGMERRGLRCMLRVMLAGSNSA